MFIDFSPGHARIGAMITSVQNPKIKWVRQLQTQAKARRQERLFVIEGLRLLQEALESGWQAELVLHAADAAPAAQSMLGEWAKRGAPVEAAAPHVLEAASDTQNPQGLLAVLVWRDLPMPPRPDFLLLADQIHDPGNLGTLLRTAAAAGVQAAVLAPDCADAFSPKVLRAGMGAHFRLPVLTQSWEQIAALVSREKLRLFLAESGGGQAYTEAHLRQPLVLGIGSEAHGFSPQAKAIQHSRLHIPMPGGSESLNAGVAAGIMLFEVVRQRQHKEFSRS